MSLHRGITAALAAALLFGASTPFAKLLLDQVQPWMLAALLYLGSGLGLAVWRLLLRLPMPVLPPADRLWLAGAVVTGGMIAPVLLMVGLSRMPASNASLLLNAETVLTAPARKFPTTPSPRADPSFSKRQSCHRHSRRR